MNFLDFLLLIPMVWLAYKGFSKGLIMGLFSVAALLVGIYACLHFTDWTSEKLKEQFEDSWATLAIWVYVVTFCGAFAAVYFSGKLVEKLVSVTGLSLLNQLGGAFLGLVKALLLCSGLLVAINALNVNDSWLSQKTKEKSLLYQPISDFSGWLIPAFERAEWLKETFQTKEQQSNLPLNKER